MHKDEPSNPYHRQERAAVHGEFGPHPPVLAPAVCAEGGGRGDDEFTRRRCGGLEHHRGGLAVERVCGSESLQSSVVDGACAELMVHLFVATGEPPKRVRSVRVRPFVGPERARHRHVRLLGASCALLQQGFAPELDERRTARRTVVINPTSEQAIEIRRHSSPTSAVLHVFASFTDLDRTTLDGLTLDQIIETSRGVYVGGYVLQGACTHKIGHYPTQLEYANYWDITDRTAQREWALFRRAFPQEESPERLARWVLSEMSGRIENESSALSVSAPPDLNLAAA